jgi:sugar lactone lactonase YvrE
VSGRRTAEVLLPCRAEVGEGPTYDMRSDELVWVDILAGHVHRTTVSGAVDRVLDVGTHVGAALPAERPGLLLAVRDGWAYLTEDGAVTGIETVLAGHPEIRFNDAKCDPAGRAFGGTMAYDPTPGTGTLFRLDPGGRSTVVLSGLTISNGLGWTPDGRHMYFIDSGTQQLAGYDYDLETGAMSNRTVLADFDRARDGMPDGLAVDSEGCAWVALWGGGQVRRYSPQGEWLDTIEVPASQPTSVAFIGADLMTLAITTARYRLTPQDLATQPYAGSVFASAVAVPGLPTTPWKDNR